MGIQITVFTADKVCQLQIQSTKQSLGNEVDLLHSPFYLYCYQIIVSVHVCFYALMFKDVDFLRNKIFLSTCLFTVSKTRQK